MDNRREMKQVIVMRTDLNMRKGKMCAQSSHASMAFLTRTSEFVGHKFTVKLDNAEEAFIWMQEGFTKICVKIDSEHGLMELYDKALRAGLEAQLIIDACFTEFNGVPTKTCIAIGPHECHKIDLITGHLQLL